MCDLLGNRYSFQNYLKNKRNVMNLLKINYSVIKLTIYRPKKLAVELMSKTSEGRVM
jgi:hypothetical protein